MTDQHPITPPPELVRKWVDLLPQGSMKAFTAAAQWGSDQELEACCEWVDRKWSGIKNRELRAVRRPKPPSLKEQALAELEEIMTELHNETGSAFTASSIRRALEQLPE